MASSRCWRSVGPSCRSPRLLLIDEASLGLSPALAKAVFQVVAQINDDGTTVVIVEQNVGVLPYADRALIMEKGTLVFSGVGDEIHHANLRETYLGSESSESSSERTMQHGESSESSSERTIRHGERATERASSARTGNETSTFVREAIMRNQWAKLGGVLGVVYCIAGFVLIFLGWNGTASNDRVEAQMPYVVSGGIAGLALVVLGAALIVAHSLRTDRVELRASIDELRRTVAVVTASGSVPGSVAPTPVTPAEGAAVVAGVSSYHVPSCALVAGQAGAAADRGGRRRRRRARTLPHLPSGAARRVAFDHGRQHVAGAATRPAA